MVIESFVSEKMSKIFLISLLLFSTRCASKPWRSFTVLQKSVGITIHDPITVTTPTTVAPKNYHPPTLDVNNETDPNATRMIENVLNTVVQSSMNDMLLKLTNSLSDLFSVFTAGRHQRKQMKDEIEAHLSASSALKLDSSSITSKIDTNSAEMSSDRTTYRNNNAVIDDDSFDRKTEIENKNWWRSILTKILTKNKKQQSSVSDGIVSNESPTTIGYHWDTLTTTNEILFDISRNLPSTYIFEHENATDEFQIPGAPIEAENDSQIVDEMPMPSIATTVATFNRISVAPYWELLIRLDNGLEGVLKNHSIVPSTSTASADFRQDETTVSDVISPDAVVSNVNNLITGDPDAVSPTKKITPLPNRPSNKSKNLFMQTVLVSCAAVFAIFVFSCLGIALVCFGKKRGNNRQSRLGVLPRFDPTTGAGIFGRPIFKTSSAAAGPYYYDSSARSDWSLMSRDRDRQVETYFATASILDTSCDSSPSTSNSHPVSIPPDTAIMH